MDFSTGPSTKLPVIADLGMPANAAETLDGLPYGLLPIRPRRRRPQILLPGRQLAGHQLVELHAQRLGQQHHLQVGQSALAAAG